MKRIEFTCDGCDLVERVALPADGNANFMFEGWTAHRVIAEENGSATYDISADLCPRCSEKIRHAINPANWPRSETTIRAFARK